MGLSELEEGHRAMPLNFLARAVAGCTPESIEMIQVGGSQKFGAAQLGKRY